MIKYFGVFIDGFIVWYGEFLLSEYVLLKYYFYMLIDKELVILKKILVGEINKKIVNILFISEKIVCSYCLKIYLKFGVRILFELYLRLKYELFIV